MTKIYYFAVFFWELIALSQAAKLPSLTSPMRGFTGPLAVKFYNGRGAIVDLFKAEAVKTRALEADMLKLNEFLELRLFVSITLFRVEISEAEIDLFCADENTRGSAAHLAKLHACMPLASFGNVEHRVYSHSWHDLKTFRSSGRLACHNIESSNTLWRDQFLKHKARKGGKQAVSGPQTVGGRALEHVLVMNDPSLERPVSGARRGKYDK